MKNEKNYLKIIDDELISEAINQLKKIKSDLKNLDSGKEIIEKTNLLIKILKHAKGKFEKINTRVAQEERMLREDEKLYDKEFRSTFKEELKQDIKITKLFEKSKLKKITEFSGKIIAIATGLIGGIATGATIATGSFLVTIIGPIMAKSLEANPKVYGTIIAIGGILGAVAGVGKAIEEYELLIYKKQLPVLKELKMD